ncbi:MULTISPECIES: hypothetical protein [unclassified Rhodococcus (in: high G+C Gram-positive bacteria)]|uniref:hypothetical protein n=1 Tax=unclassified Rhodococcus (in: high G+C Gram-positive bacteria) TaxID=192944 RepID=UPI0016397E24|nr:MULTISPECIES: hypothetical protein [unclassified Rhodococcus (in: high G+C Gram-positive bacteria)]MBC2637712.1 hypothetical protein [Rhodococcus sp. 3A]MBC2897544.1 hypothetical protein [Rhodococcus sp. 4CII]
MVLGRRSRQTARPGRVDDLREQVQRARAAADSAAAAARAAAENAEKERGDDGASELPESPPTGRRSARYRAVVAAAAVACLGAGALAIQTTLDHRATQRSVAADTRVLAFTEDAVARLLSTDTDDAKAYVERVLADSTGDWRTEFEQRKTATIDTMRQAGNRTAGRTLEAGIEGRENDTTTVLVSATAQTTPAPADPAAAPEPQIQQYQIRVGVTMVDDQPKLSSVGFVQ